MFQVQKIHTTFDKNGNLIPVKVRVANEIFGRKEFRVNDEKGFLWS